jgi:hypothetical protein
MNRVAFFSGLIVLAVGLAVWILRPGNPSRTSRIKAFGIELSSGVPAFVVMALGLALMILSVRFPDNLLPEAPSPSKPPDPIKKIVCTGQYEGNCPGAHDIFYTCGYFGSDEQIAERVCAGIKSGALRLKTVGGNQCGYALIEVTCHRER